MRIHKKLTHLFKGFTLVELIVVISVLAVLASIAMSQVSNITAWARDSQRMTDMSAMKSSIELYKAKTGKLPIPTNGSGVTYSWGLLWTQGTFGEPTWRQLNSITPKPVDPNNSIEYVYSVANNNREFELGGILEKATGYFPNILPELLAASQNITFIEGTYNWVSLKVETGSKTYVVAAPSLIGGYLGATMENTGLTIEWLWSLPKGFSGVVVSTAQTGTFTPVIAWSGAKLPETSTGAEAMILGLQNAYSGSNAISLSQISSLVSATGSQITALGEGLVENALGGDITGQSSSGGGGGGNFFPLLNPLACDSPVVTTFAGTNTPGFVDATGNAARFNSLHDIAIDSSGNIYVPDAGSHSIRKVTPAGVVTTIAGTNTPGFVDATGNAARFNGPYWLTVDNSGNIYVADTGNNAIRKVTPAGVVTTIAGTNIPGFVDATGNAARFNGPYGITMDNLGNLYVADMSNQAIRKITPTGVVTTFAGSTSGAFWYTDDTGNAARFKNPTWVASDSAWNIYVADSSNQAIRKITPTGVVTTFAGSTAGTPGATDSTGTSARFDTPVHLSVDNSGNIYVADSSNQAIRKITSAWVVSTLAGSGPSGGYINAIGTAARFNYPYGVTPDGLGNLYVADLSNYSIRKLSCP